MKKTKRITFLAIFIFIAAIFFTITTDYFNRPL